MPEDSPDLDAGIRGFTRRRRNLPHWQCAGEVYFLTWRTWRGAILDHPERDLTLKAILHWNTIRWQVFAAVVMPDHVHGLCRACPIPESDIAFHDLSKTLHSVKSFSAHEIARIRADRCRVWQDETYDRIVRSPEEFEEKWSYIHHNPVKAGLVKQADDYGWFYGMPVELRGDAVMP